jgi:hypothetical protein
MSRSNALALCACACALGFAVAYVAFAIPAKRHYEDALVFQAESDLRTLTLLQTNGIRELVRIKERGLANEAGMLLAGELKGHPGADYWAWKIRAYFQSTTNGIPGEIAPLLKTLPNEQPSPAYPYWK